MDQEVHEFLLKHLQGIMANDIVSYHETTAADLTLYEWWVTPHRLDGLPFHEFMMNSNAERGAVLQVAAHNESRVMVKMDRQWKVVHAHKSPAYAAPHVG